MIKRLASVLLALLMLGGACALASQEEKAHYLLIGVDGWGVSEESSSRSDAIILATLDYDNDRVVLVSFARDSLVRPAFRKGKTKLNTLVRAEQGDSALVEYIEDVFAVPVSGYFLVNFSGAVDVINAVGGVNVELTEEEVRYLNANAGGYDDYPLQEGICRLNGGQALAYMRCRELDNDFGRQHRQSNVLRAVFRELTQLSALEAVGLFSEVLGMYRTDLTVLEQMTLARDALDLRHAQIQTHSLPVAGTYKYGEDGSGASGLEFDLSVNRQHLWEWLGMEPLAAAE